MSDLRAKVVAVVTGASRGAGRAIAMELGLQGATVYVTGRSTRGGERTEGRRETIEDTAEAVTECSGVGIAVRCDHTDDAQVAALFERVAQEQGGRLDLLVNNAWGGYERYDHETFSAPFWQQPFERYDRMLTAGLRAHLVTAHYAAPILVNQGRGLIVNTTTAMGKPQEPDFYYNGAVYDTVKRAVARLSYCMAEDLRPYGVACVALAPGFMRTERVLDAFGVPAEKWQSVPEMRQTETPFYIGRAVTALLSDADAVTREKTGRLLLTGELAREYGFTDVDGRQVPPFAPEEEAVK